MPRKTVSEYRAPSGVVVAKPISVRLLPDELVRFQRHAQADGRAKANMARVLILEAMDRRDKSKRTRGLPQPPAIPVAEG